jgi:hypothetical protein
VLAASPALAGSLVTVTTTTAETTAGDGACSLAEALAYAQRLNGSNTDCGTTATGTTVISLAEGTYARPWLYTLPGYGILYLAAREPRRERRPTCTDTPRTKTNT